MKPNFENTSQLGRGIYTIPDVANLLGIPYYKANRWINEYWDRKLANPFSNQYSWTDGKAKAVSFHTLIELYTFFQLSDAGVKTKVILEAHKLLSEKYNTVFPFATSSIINNMFTDGRKVFFKENEKIICTLDSTLQLNLDFVKLFFKKLDFGDKDLANRLWPMGKQHHIVIDPSHQFGQPVINGTNIIPSTINQMLEAGEPSEFVGAIYNLDAKQIEDAVSYCKLAA